MSFAARLVLPALFLLALGLRAATLGLPLEGASAVLASVGDHLGHERGWTLAGNAPLQPLLVAMLVASGAPATAALRWTDVLLVALLAPLLAALARRVGATRAEAALAGLVVALHPLGVMAAGGVAPGTSSAGAALLLASIHLLLGSRAGARALGAVLALALPLADPVGLFLMPPLLAAYLARRGAGAGRYVLVVVGTALLLVGPVSLRDVIAAGGDGAAAPQDLLLWLGSAGLVVLWVGAPAGLMRLVRVPPDRRGVTRAWLAGSGLQALALAFLPRDPAAGLGPLAAAALPLLPLVALACVLGLARLSPRLRARLVGGTLAAAALAASWLAFGSLQVALRPGALAEAGRLQQLGAAYREAARAAGPDGWIVLALLADRPAEQASLADLAPGCWTWREGEGPAPTDPLRRLLPFPAATFQPGQSVAVLARAGTTSDVHTFGGAGIFQQELVRALGPYVILRARRP